MNAVVIVAFLTIWGLASAQYRFNMDGNEYQFSFKTGDVGDHTREETRDTFGTVIGKYSYVDPFGHRREMRYRADENGFQPEGYAVSRPAVRVPEIPEVVEQEEIVETRDEEHSDTDLQTKAQLPITEETKTEASTDTIEDETEVSVTEPEVATTDSPSTTATRASSTTQFVANTTEANLDNDVAIPTPSTRIVQRVDENGIEEVSPTSGQRLKEPLSLQQPEYPTVLRSPSIPELPLPIAFYHPYRLFNSNVRPIPFIRQGNAGPITFF